jgi:hypothetical protein
MNRRVGAMSTFVTLVLIPLVITVAPMVIPTAALPSVLVVSVSALVLWLAWSVLSLFPHLLLPITRGVTKVASDRQRTAEFTQPWRDATAELYTWGVGMRKLSRDVDVIEHAVRRDIHVVVDITDAEYVRASSGISRLIDVTYRHDNFVEQIEESTRALVLVARELNKKYGADKIQVWAVATYVAQSGTVADPGLDKASGWVEYHTSGFPNGQARFRMRRYRHRSHIFNPPLLQHLLESRKHLPRRRIDVEDGPTQLQVQEKQAPQG